MHHSDWLHGDHAAEDHCLEFGQKCFDLRLGIDDLDDNGQIG